MSEKLEAQRQVSDWLKKYGWNIYWDQKNKDGYETFHTNNRKPDILAQKNGYNVLIEVKPGKKHQSILDGTEQTIEYAGEYYTGRTIYMTEKPGKPIEIDAFLFATKYSQYGYLYSEEDQHNYVKSKFLQEHYQLIERPITHSITRKMWRSWHKGLAIEHYKELRKGDKAEEAIRPQKPKIGILTTKIDSKTRAASDEPYFYLNSNEFSNVAEDRIYALD